MKDFSKLTELVKKYMADGATPDEIMGAVGDCMKAGAEGKPEEGKPDEDEGDEKKAEEMFGLHFD